MHLFFPVKARGIKKFAGSAYVKPLKKVSRQFPQGTDPDEFDLHLRQDFAGKGPGQDAAREAHPRRLPDPDLRLGDSPYLAGQTDLADSSTFTPPATFKKISLAPRWVPQILSITAVSSDTRL